MDLDRAVVREVARRELLAAEDELLQWGMGKRSYINEMMSVENYVGDSSEHGPGIGPDRSQTLVRVAERDAAEIQAQRERVLALRLLANIPTPEKE